MEKKRMRKSSSSRRSHVWADKDDFLVAAILIDMTHFGYRHPPGIAKLLSVSSWGCKKRRSAIGVDYQGDVFVVCNKTPAATPGPAPSQHHKLQRPRHKSESANKTREGLLKLVEELSECKQMLTKEIGVVKAYYNKLLTRNSILRAKKKDELQKRSIEEGKIKAVTTSLKNAETNAAAVVPPQQPLSFMYPTTKKCQVLPSEGNCSFGNAGLDKSSRGLPPSCRAMDPSAWPHSFELEGRIDANKHQAAEARRRKMNKIKCGRN